MVSLVLAWVILVVTLDLVLETVVRCRSRVPRNWWLVLVWAALTPVLTRCREACRRPAVVRRVDRVPVLVLVTWVLCSRLVCRPWLTEPRQLILLETPRTRRPLKTSLSRVRLLLVLLSRPCIKVTPLLPIRLGARSVNMLCRPFLRALWVTPLILL